MEVKYIPYEKINHINTEYYQDGDENGIIIEIFTEKISIKCRYFKDKLITKTNVVIVFINQDGVSWATTPLKMIESLDKASKMYDKI